MKIALVGWGVETKSAYKYFGGDHEYFIVSEEPIINPPDHDKVITQTLDKKRTPGLTSTVSDLAYLEGIEQCDLIIYTPTARKNLESLYKEGHPLWQKMTTTMNLFFEQCPTKNIIGVTGTKGKGTTTTLIAQLLKKAGKQVHVGGNIGVAVLDLLPDIKPNDWVVLEMSSFQLYKFPYSPHIAVHLMMIPEHIAEWHKTMDDYVAAKRNICAHQNKNDIVIYNAANEYSRKNAASSKGKHIPCLKPPGAYIKKDMIMIDNQVVLPTDKVGLLGRHNLENICASLTAAWQVTKDTAAYAQVLREFKGLEHRLQLVGEINSVQFYDDSFGTTPDTAVVAMEAIKSNKVMIVGGHDKGNDYTSMINRLTKQDIKTIIAIGLTGNALAHTLIELGLNREKIVFKEEASDWTMEEIVSIASNHAQPGDAVLLSTGSASFGLFKDYKDRGNQFIAAVVKLNP